MNDTLYDPISGKEISVIDQHYNVLSVYYHILPVYEKEFRDALDLYNRTFHQYAIQLLQTAMFLNIKTRPPGFRPSPLPPTAHKLVLNKDYTFSLPQVPVSQQPPDPDPATQTLKPNPDDPNDYLIVPITAPPIQPMVGSLTDTVIINYLKPIYKSNPEFVMHIFNAVMGGS